MFDVCKGCHYNRRACMVRSGKIDALYPEVSIPRRNLFTGEEEIELKMGCYRRIDFQKPPKNIPQPPGQMAMFSEAP